MSPRHAVTHKRFDEENEDRFELPGNAGYATATGQGRQVWLLELWVDPGQRGQGHATALLEAVIAHYQGRMLALSAEPFSRADDEPPGLPAGQLAAWYARHGFEEAGGYLMRRRPGTRRAGRDADPAARGLTAGPDPGQARDELPGQRLVDAVKDHAAACCGEPPGWLVPHDCPGPGWHVIRECWSDNDIAAAIRPAATLEEAITALTPFLTRHADPAAAASGLAFTAFSPQRQHAAPAAPRRSPAASPPVRRTP